MGVPKWNPKKQANLRNEIQNMHAHQTNTLYATRLETYWERPTKKRPQVSELTCCDQLSKPICKTSQWVQPPSSGPLSMAFLPSTLSSTNITSAGILASRNGTASAFLQDHTGWPGSVMAQCPRRSLSDVLHYTRINKIKDFTYMETKQAFQ